MNSNLIYIQNTNQRKKYKDYIEKPLDWRKLKKDRYEFEAVGEAISPTHAQRYLR